MYIREKKSQMCQMSFRIGATMATSKEKKYVDRKLKEHFHRKPTYRGIRRFKIKEIPFREDFPCHSTWKRCKHSGHFSRFRNIIGNFCIIKQKCLCNYVINIRIRKNIFEN
jgi:hypothetical protein